MNDRRNATSLAGCAAGACLLGTAFIATQYLSATPVWNAVLRVVPAGLLLLLIWPARPRGVWWLRSWVLGVVNFSAFFALQAFAAHRLPGAVVATITAAQCLVVPMILLAQGQQLRLAHITASALGMLGVSLLVLQGSARLDLPGVLASALLAMLCAGGLLLTRAWAPPAHPVSAVSWQLLAGGLTLVPIAFVVEGTPPAMSASQIVAGSWLAVGATAAAFSLFFGGLYRGVAPTTASRLLLLAPVVAAVAGWAWAGEHLSPLQLAGIACVLATQFAGATPKPAPKPTPIAFARPLEVSR